MMSAFCLEMVADWERRLTDAIACVPSVNPPLARLPQIALKGDMEFRLSRRSAASAEPVLQPRVIESMADDLNRLSAALSSRYTIERELGSGGMATVYLAEDVKHHRKVAVKVLRPELAAVLGTERFLQEIEIAAQLQHPHILALYDSGEADGFLYYVMPYVEGESVRDKLAKEGELPIGDAVRILRDVVDALTEAHAHGVVHRDIKPENILLRGRHALVTDFGVAKAVSEATGREKLTTAGGRTLDHAGPPTDRDRARCPLGDGTAIVTIRRRRGRGRPHPGSRASVGRRNGSGNGNLWGVLSAGRFNSVPTRGDRCDWWSAADSLRFSSCTV